jgi:hypothetical protein
MGQLTEPTVRAILAGQGVTQWEIEQLCNFWLKCKTPFVVTPEMVSKARAGHGVDRISNGEIIDSIAGPNYGDRLIQQLVKGAMEGRP